MHCGSTLTAEEKISEVDKLHRELNETKKANELLKTALESQLNKEEEKPEIIQPEPTENNTTYVAPPPPPINPPVQVPPPPRNIATQPYQKPKSNKTAIFLIMALAAFAILVFGIFYYNNVYLPEKRDKEADRYYTFAEKTNLRSTKESGGEYNRIKSLNFGSELITYTHNINGWSEVKDAEGKEGYISSSLLLNKEDYSILNNIFGNQDSRECINTTKCRLALLNYYKSNNLNSDWKVYCKKPEIKPNAVFFPKLYDKNARFTDFAAIITNEKTNIKKVVIFGFNDDESVAWIKDGVAEGKYIKNVYLNYYGNVFVDYSN
jgi:hypothetical protein